LQGREKQPPKKHHNNQKPCYLQCNQILASFGLNPNPTSIQPQSDQLMHTATKATQHTNPI
jgi:hypothetical protein